MNVTRADPDKFELPVKRLNVSGGTAPFFKLKLKQAPQSRSVHHYIGKDLSRATDEISFYEGILELQKQKDDTDSKLANLLEFAFEYLGVITAPEEGVDGPDNSVELLVLENLFDGCKRLRLLDIKMGEATASAGWMGKSAFRAKKQGVIDHMTNSTVEGYRLEGFEGQPPALLSMNPLMDLSIVDDEKKRKKATRLQFQSMTGNKMFLHFLDLQSNSKQEESDNFTPIEVAEIVMHEVVIRLCRLAIACHRVSTPQKWVGSSIGLGFDCENTSPSRTKSSEDVVRASVIARIFDWGRSELNTSKKHETLKEQEKDDRKKYWQQYTCAMSKLSLIAARTYMNLFGNSNSWKDITFTIIDFDSVGSHDILGRVTVPLEATGGIVEEKVLGRRSSKSKFFYSIEWQHFAPSLGSRLKGRWNICVDRATDLPNADVMSGMSDPYCVVTALSSNGELCFEHMTCVKQDTLNPVWKESLDLPIATDADFLGLTLEELGIFRSNSTDSLFDLLGPSPTMVAGNSIKGFFGSLVGDKHANKIQDNWENALKSGKEG